MKLYIVNAYRNGDREKHSYTVATFSNELKAIDCAESHCTFRAGKYSCIVESLFLDVFNNEEEEYTKQEYETVIPHKQPFQRKFSQREIEQLQSSVYEITGKGEVMGLFNSLLGVSVGSGS